MLNMGDRESRMWTVSCSRSGIDGDMYEGKALRNKLNVYEVSSALKLSNLQSGVAAHPEDLVENTQMLPALGHIGNNISTHDLLERSKPLRAKPIEHFLDFFRVLLLDRLQQSHHLSETRNGRRSTRTRM